MALGSLMILFIVLVILAVILQILLYKNNNRSKNSNMLFIINTIFSLFLSFMAFSALPSNFTGQKSLALAWGALGLLALILKFTSKTPTIISKLMLTISILGALVQSFL